MLISRLSAEYKEVRSKTKKSTPVVKTLRSNSIQSVVSVVSESNTTASVTKVGIFSGNISLFHDCIYNGQRF